MTTGQGWAHAGHAERYRERVLAERERLADALTDPHGQQRHVLADLLDFNSGTEFGKRHGFARILGIDDFRKAVPVQDYAAHAPLIERTAAGEPNLLSADRPVVYFTSSGSTGAHKKIPVTPRFMRTTFFPFYYAAWAPLVENFPDVANRPDAVLNLKHDPLAAPPTTADGRPHVGASQVDFGERFGEPLSAELGTAAPWATLPVDVAPDDHLEKMYLRLRLAVQSDVRCLIGINPAMIAAVPYQLTLWWDRIVKEVRDGTLGGVPHGSSDPGRAAELEKLADYFGAVSPAQVWPRVRALFGWTTGVASLYLPELRERFGIGVTALPAPVAASEGPVGVPLDRHGSAGSLVVSAAVYEFADADTDLEPDTETLLPHELEPGREYHVIFSHVGGLYRYAVGDVVRVVDLVHGVPRVEYAGRAGRSDVAGERLRESQVVRALRSALTATGLGLANVACRVEPAPGTVVPRYVFAIAPLTPWQDGETARFTALLDTALTEESAGYRRARTDSRLSAPAVHLLDPDAFHRDWHAAVGSGIRPTQVKDRLFRQDDALWQRLTGTAPL
ncbi:GH3 auxin-responsive promoter family protein [Streptomyces sporangiiformans]|uniref:GH3 auxin-responsive promoter family protein n=1 Tax=Streptomyces sporangiiformans TaxID=2315329 RepID=A0A505DHF7_9ACTN|nr:GH3 auxin-responsive promoter family protein [Streptomyces sporangiiformans]TPQ18606.1 GH3 auxin-responsive promoter family protein [Streptomyces sporangiiformans]